MIEIMAIGNAVTHLEKHSQPPTERDDPGEERPLLGKCLFFSNVALRTGHHLTSPFYP